MADFLLYRKRIIPPECILLEDDIVVSFEENKLITKWGAIHPKKNLHHGISGYFLDEGIKVSKFYREDGSLVYWYIDIITYDWSENKESLCITDLLADVLIYPDGSIQVVDLDELADATQAKALDLDLTIQSLRNLNQLLSMIYDGSIKKIQDYIESFE